MYPCATAPLTHQVAELTRFLAIPEDGFTLETITNLIVMPQRTLPVDERYSRARRPNARPRPLTHAARMHAHTRSRAKPPSGPPAHQRPWKVC